MARESLKRCNNCGCWVAGMWDRFPKFDCAKGEQTETGRLCPSTRIMLLESALRRALKPDAFDERSRVKPDRLLEVLDAENAALRSAAALLGPVSAAAFANQNQIDEAEHG